MKRRSMKLSFARSPPTTQPPASSNCCTHVRQIDTTRKEHSMQVSEMLSSAREAMTVKRVFGEPIEKDGVTIIPVARIAGGGGGGSGDSEEGSGSGGGYGVMAKP